MPNSLLLRLSPLHGLSGWARVPATLRTGAPVLEGMPVAARGNARRSCHPAAPVLRRGCEKAAAEVRKLGPGVFQHSRQAAAHLPWMLRQDDAVLGQQPADLVNQLRAAGGKPAAYSMQALKILLIEGLLAERTHVGSRHGFADRFRSSAPFFWDFTYGLDELWRHQPHRMVKPVQHTRPVNARSRWLRCQPRTAPQFREKSASPSLRVSFRRSTARSTLSAPFS